MTLKNGKFYDTNGVQVPLEFGNKEQINLINRAQKKVDALNGEGDLVDIRTTNTYEVFYKCICGSGMLEFTVDHHGDDEDCLIGLSDECRWCQREYILQENESGDIVIKLDI